VISIGDVFTAARLTARRYHDPTIKLEPVKDTAVSAYDIDARDMSRMKLLPFKTVDGRSIIASGPSYYQTTTGLNTNFKLPQIGDVEREMHAMRGDSIVVSDSDTPRAARRLDDMAGLTIDSSM
jgi:hypothetical protein